MTGFKETCSVAKLNPVFRLISISDRQTNNTAVFHDEGPCTKIITLVSKFTVLNNVLHCAGFEVFLIYVSDLKVNLVAGHE